MFLKAPQVRLQKVKHSLRIQGVHARHPQTDYAAFLLLYDAPAFGDELLGAAKIAFRMHLSDNAQAANRASTHPAHRGEQREPARAASRKKMLSRTSD